METILPLLTALKKLDLQQRGPSSRFGDRAALIKAQSDWAEAGYPMPSPRLIPAMELNPMLPEEEGLSWSDLMATSSEEKLQDFQQEMHRLTGQQPRSSGREK